MPLAAAQLVSRSPGSRRLGMQPSVNRNVSRPQLHTWNSQKYTNCAVARDTSVMALIAIVTTPGCKYCKRAKEVLKTNEIAYEEVEVQGDIELLTKFREASGRRTVPQIFLEGKCFGGSDEVVAALEDGSFQKLVEAAASPPLTPVLQEAVEKSRERQAKAAQALAVSQQADSGRGELEALAALMATADTGLPRTTAHKGWWRHEQQVFTSQAAAEWLTRTQPSTCPTPEAAFRTLASLQASSLIYDISQQPAAADAPPPSPSNTSALYRLRSDAPPPRPGHPLNGYYPWYGPARPATQVAAELRGLVLELYDKYLSTDGRAVSYKKMALDPLWGRFVDATAELQKVDIQPLSREELMSMFINLYNVLIIHATVVHGPAASFTDRLKFFTSTCKYIIAGQQYTADDLEHGVLRGNIAAPAALFRKHQFKPSDERAKKIITDVDHRIHFALVCGAKSCPPIRLYTPESLEEGLQGAAEAFCSGEVVPDPANRTVTLSMIFKWYGVDFGSNETEVLRALVKYLPVEQQEVLTQMLASGEKIKVEYKPYDWSVNSDE